MDQPLLELRFALEPRDFGKAAQIHVGRRFAKTIKQVGVCGLLLLPPLAWLALRREGGAAPLYVTAALLLLLIVPIFALHVYFGRQGRALAARSVVPPEIVWRIGPAKVEIGDGMNFDVALWDTWIGFVDAGDYVLLYLSVDGFQIVPKRAFRTPEELQFFRGLLKEKFTRR